MKKIIGFPVTFLMLFLLTSLVTFSYSQETEQILLKNYRPVSIYKIPVTNITKAAYPVIDMHTHDYATTDAEVKAWIMAMDACGIQKSIVMTETAGPAFDSIYALYSPYPDRFEVWCGFDYTGYDKPGFGPEAVKELERCFRLGARGVGEEGDKGLGLFYNDPVKAWGMHFSDSRMKPLFEKCAELHMPVNIHVADPIWMYEKMDSTNDGLMNALTWKVDLSKPGIIGFDNLIETLEIAVKNNPNTVFIACHFANLNHDPERLGRLLDKYPNLYADISARYAESATIPRTMKAFYEKYQDRLLYGTDMNYDPSMYRTTFRILESTDEHFYETAQFGYHWALNGFGLSDGVLKKIYHDNAARIAGGREKVIPTAAMLGTMSERMNHTLEKSTDLARFPRTVKQGALVTSNRYEWTSGFFPGNLLYLYELTGNQKYRDQGIIRTEALDSIQYWSGSHDVGFMMNCSYGNALRITGNKKYEKVLIQTAESLCKRFSPVTGCIKSWDYSKAWNDTVEWHFPVIIDNMMNLELLFRATQLSGNPVYADIALKHAQTTMKNHYRPDYSCYHVVNYDTLTGAVLDKATHQGFTDESSWSRGQAWGLYGFVMTYRFTRDTQYLDFATRIASYLMNFPTLPEDGVPYWDYLAPDTSQKPEWKYNPAKYQPIPRDAAAAAIMASALLELSTSVEQGSKYRAFGEKILRSLASAPYFGANGNDYFILSHCTGSLPHNSEVDVPLVYADYYFMEGLLRLNAMKTP